MPFIVLLLIILLIFLYYISTQKKIKYFNNKFNEINDKQIELEGKINLLTDIIKNKV